MKTRILAVIAAILIIAGPAFAAALITISELQKTNSSATVPVQLSTSSAQFRRATIYGKKTARTDNTGTVWIGFSSTNDTQMVPIAAGASVVIESPEGYFYDFTNVWLDVGTVDDGVMVIYSQP